MKKILPQKNNYICVLVLLWVGLMLVTVPRGTVYGSSVDWISQHVALAETIRKACLEQGTLLPSFLNLGAGSNGFAFSYYGYLRPDIILGCLLPQIPMYAILISYMLGGYLVSVLICYQWLEIESKSPSAAFWGSILFMLASCFFHTHRQVMFVNYMPFFMGALLSIKKKHYGRTAVFLTLSYLNSFYYIPVILVAILWYWYRTEGKRFLAGYLRTVSLSVGMTAILLVPTFFIILEHRRDGTGIDQMLGFLPKMNFLLYSPYGIGLTLVCLYLMMAGLSSGIYRKDSAFLLAFCSFGISAWLLNGGLYVRGKILIPFLPLIILQSVRVLLALHRKEMKWQLWPFLFILFCLFSCRSQGRVPEMALDALLLFFFCIGKRYFFKDRPYFYAVLLVMPFFFWMQSARQETFVPLESLDKIESMALFPQTEALYRFDSLYEPLGTGNRDASMTRAKSTMYSSITNQAYAKVYYDLLKTPVQINNRIALLPEENPFLFQFMGIRYLETTEDKVPVGYEIIQKEEELVLAENRSVLPIAYTVDEVMPETAFWELEELERLDVLARHTVVEEARDDLKEIEGEKTRVDLKEIERKETGPDTDERRNELPIQSWESGFKSINLTFSNSEQSENLQIQEQSGGGWEILAKGEASLTLYLEKPVREEILMLEFEVENLENEAVVIDINGIRNKLSGRGAAYPNRNERFSYQFSEEGEGIKTLTIRLSGGHYRMKDVRWHLYDKNLLIQKNYTHVSLCSVKGNEILACRSKSNTDSYFITSIPNQRGLKILIDGVSVPVLNVNTAFAGAKLSPGVHEIKIQFSPPGLFAGRLISIGTILLFFMECLRRKKTGTFSE